MSSYFSAGRLQWVIRGTRFGVTCDKPSLEDVLHFLGVLYWTDWCIWKNDALTIPALNNKWLADFKSRVNYYIVKKDFCQCLRCNKTIEAVRK
jgi:hypothetical protein